MSWCNRACPSNNVPPRPSRVFSHVMSEQDRIGTVAPHVNDYLGHICSLFDTLAGLFRSCLPGRSGAVTIKAGGTTQISEDANTGYYCKQGLVLGNGRKVFWGRVSHQYLLRHKDVGRQRSDVFFYGQPLPKHLTDATIKKFAFLDCSLVLTLTFYLF